jgi:flagellar hook-basal body complex protein FliE
MGHIREKLLSLQKRNQLDEFISQCEKDIQQLILAILNGHIGQFQERYDGQDNIFQFLKFLNDMMRLASKKPHINVELPIEEYESIEDFPSIEVEFIHLNNSNKLTQGRFALLDTPGPNERDLEEKLRPVVKAQLARASAVLAILDYTQFNCVADGQVRDELERQTAQVEDRLFVIVNKFDQRDRHSMKADEVKHHVAKGLMGGSVTHERVYPVSARYGYLANRVLHEISEKGRLPDYEVHGWVADFGELAMGVDWEEEIDQLDEVKVSAKKLWKKSRFDAPLNEVVVKAANQAALVSMQSATAKMLDFGNRLENFLEIRRGGLTKTVQELQGLIKGLKQDIVEVEQAEKKAEQALQTLVDEFLKVAHFKYENSKELLKIALEGYFQEGKKIEASVLEKKREELEQQFVQTRKEHEGFFEAFWVVISGQSKKEAQLRRKAKDAATALDFDPSNPRVTFDDKQVAKFFLRTINDKIISIVTDAGQQLEIALKDLSKGLEKTIPKILTERIGEILENAQRRLQGAGFSIEFNVPEPNLKSGGVDMSEILLATLKEDTRTIWKRDTRRKKGFWGKTTRFFGEFFHKDSWGMEEYLYSEEERIHVINMEKVRKRVLADLESNVQRLNKSHQEFFDNILKPDLDKYFGGLKDYLEEFRGDLKDSINDHKLDEQAQQQLMQQIVALKKKSTLHTKDVQTIKANL